MMHKYQYDTAIGEPEVKAEEAARTVASYYREYCAMKERFDHVSLEEVSEQEPSNSHDFHRALALKFDEERGEELYENARELYDSLQDNFEASRRKIVAAFEDAVLCGPGAVEGIAEYIEPLRERRMAISSEEMHPDHEAFAFYSDLAIGSGVDNEGHLEYNIEEGIMKEGKRDDPEPIRDAFLELVEEHRERVADGEDEEAVIRDILSRQEEVFMQD